jgi:ADP-ribose pyrophosphatase
VYQSPWVNLYLDNVKFPNGFVIEKFHVLDFDHTAVAAVVENESGNILFARIYRYITDTTNWEIPAGGVDPGETIIDAGRREVLEETGYTTENHQLIYSYYPMNGSANKFFHVVFCRAVDQNQEFDRNEVSEIRWVSRNEVEEMIKDKVISDGYTLTALLLWLQGISS